MDLALQELNEFTIINRWSVSYKQSYEREERNCLTLPVPL